MTIDERLAAKATGFLYYITAMRSVGKPKCVEMERVDEKARNDGRG